MHNDTECQKIKDKMDMLKKNHGVGFGVIEDVVDRIAENISSLIVTVSGN